MKWPFRNLNNGYDDDFKTTGQSKFRNMWEVRMILINGMTKVIVFLDLLKTTSLLLINELVQCFLMNITIRGIAEASEPLFMW